MKKWGLSVFFFFDVLSALLFLFVIVIVIVIVIVLFSFFIFFFLRTSVFCLDVLRTFSFASLYLFELR